MSHYAHPIYLPEEDRHMALLGCRQLQHDGLYTIRKTIISQLATYNCEVTLRIEWLNQTCEYFSDSDVLAVPWWYFFELLDSQLQML